MQKHKKLYCKAFGINEGDHVACEVCNSPAVDIHHINSRKMGGDKLGIKDHPINLMSVCRRCHNKFGDKKKYIDFLYDKHFRFIKKTLGKIPLEWIEHKNLYL